MSLAFTVDPAQRRVFTKASGGVTLEEVLAHIRDERDVDGLPYSEIIDGRGARPELTATDVRVIVDALRQLSMRSALGPTAIIVDGDVGYGMMRMLEMLVDDVAVVRPFRQEREAIEWLNAVS
jgi:hypothetical protein